MARISVTAHCPRCGSTDIRETNVAYARLRVTEWDWVEEVGEVAPGGYDTDVDVEWVTDESDPKPYRCHGCGKWDGGLDELDVHDSAT